MIEVFRKASEEQALAALEVIYAEEVAHVAYGSKWFHFLCGGQDSDPRRSSTGLCMKYFIGALKPLQRGETAEAGIPPDFYWHLGRTGRCFRVRR